ncbi:hypothetical protein ABEB36_008019 [Hypothenemus hampei]|uniref:Endonuclease/exonuclease/phosphatase family domain-containing protein 1 n=1 Tax=Hypothenemus hampei TaxID=57062 RepID=A0ABD1EKM0_HYPHA
MGNHASLPTVRKKSSHSFKRKSHKRNLSHTFTLPDVQEVDMQLININSATEEELMTLPGVNREIAKNIVEYRKAIGRYRKVEDLALVKGIGADKLDFIRPEICVLTRRNQSRNSSRAPSFDSLRSNESKSLSRFNKTLDINTATVFELQSIPGVTQEIAACIVTRRNKKGKYNKLNELLKIKGINRVRLDHIAQYLNAPSDIDAVSESSTVIAETQTNGLMLMPYINGNNYSAQCNGHIPMNGTSTMDVFDLLSTYSPRPTLSEIFKYERNGEPALRIGSWNLDDLTMDKASNLGIKEVICMTILEHGISLLAVQGVNDVFALKAICDELNKPTLKRVSQWQANSQDWSYCMLDIPGAHLAFLFDTIKPVPIDMITLIEGPSASKDYCDMIVGEFKIGQTKAQIVNMSIKKWANFKILNDKFDNLFEDQYVERIITCMDFSRCEDIQDPLTLEGMIPVFPSDTVTCFQTDCTVNHTANISTNGRFERFLTGHKNVVNKGLTHLAIPKGWSWNGPVSPNLPIWVELFVKSKNDLDVI